MKTFKTTKTGFNSRIRKEKEIMAFILDSKGTLIDAIIPGSGNHKTALDWAEWRATSIINDYPACVRMEIHVGDVEIAVLEIDETDDTTTTTEAAETLKTLEEKQVRAAAAKLLPAKSFDKDFTPETGNIGLLRQMLEDHAFEHDTTAADILAAAATESATESSELTHAGQCLEIYLNNTREIYDHFTVNAIERVKRAIKAGEYVSENAEQQARDIQEITPAIQAAASLVKRYDHMTPTMQDIQQVTRNYAAYIVDCAKYEVENVKH